MPFESSDNTAGQNITKDVAAYTGKQSLDERVQIDPASIAANNNDGTYQKDVDPKDYQEPKPFPDAPGPNLSPGAAALSVPDSLPSVTSEQDQFTQVTGEVGQAARTLQS